MLTDNKFARKDKALPGGTLSSRAASGRWAELSPLRPLLFAFWQDLPFAKMRKILILSEE